jgi:hypothetical protein
MCHNVVVCERHNERGVQAGNYYGDDRSAIRQLDDDHWLLPFFRSTSFYADKRRAT